MLHGTLVYASTGNWNTSDAEHKWFACPHKPADEHVPTSAMSSRVASPGSGGGVVAAAATAAPVRWSRSATLTEPDALEGSSRKVQRQPEEQEAAVSI